MTRICGLLLICLGLSGYGSAAAQSTGSFTATSNLTVPRAGHSATLLTTGKVLITGGFADDSSGFPALATAELYDAANRTFVSAGMMTRARSGHTATLLPSGKVLIAGGDHPPLFTVELYDPSTGVFTAIGDAIAAGANTATLLNNGKVLITNGSGARLYDPDSGLFAATGSYAGRSAESVRTATLLPDGRVLLAGWSGNCEPPQLYDPLAGTFTVTEPLTGCDNVYTAGTLLLDGKVLFVGNVESNYAAAAEVFDPSTKAFTALESAPVAPASTITLLANGAVLITGGAFFGGGGSDAAWIYVPSEREFLAARMSTGRRGHTATLLPDGSVLITGGVGARPSSLGIPTTELPVLASAEVWSPALPLPSPVLFSLASDGRGQGAILHAGTPRVVSSTDSATAGDLMEIYSTGLIDGSAIPPQVAIGGRLVEILFFGKAPGFSDLNQVNIRLPSAVAPGPTVPVRMTYLNRPSNEVTIGVR